LTSSNADSYLLVQSNAVGCAVAEKVACDHFRGSFDRSDGARAACSWCILRCPSILLGAIAAANAAPGEISYASGVSVRELSPLNSSRRWPASILCVSAARLRPR
jgi:hypothetical protein